MDDKSKDRLGFWSLVCLVIGNMIGSGVYTTSGFALGDLKRADLVLLVWALGGLMALTGAVAYGALASRIPESGGEYLYLSRIVHPSVGFLAGWISLVAGFTAPIAAAALVLEEYTLQGSSLLIDSGKAPVSHASSDLEAIAISNHWTDSLPPKSIATAIVLIVASVHVLGLKTGARFQNGVVFVKLIGLVAFVAWVIFSSPAIHWYGGILAETERSAKPFQEGNFFSTLGAMFGALVWISLSYTGFNAAIYVAEDTKRSGGSKIARSMILATSLVTAFYLILNAIFLYAAPVEEIINQPRIANIAATKIGGSHAGNWMNGIIWLSALTSISSMLMAGPRVYAKMVSDNVLPSRLLRNKGSIAYPILLQAILSILVVFSSDLASLIGYMGLTLTACGALSIATIWRLPRIYPQATRVRWYEYTSAGFFLSMTCVLIVVAFRVKPIEFYAMLVTFVIGFVLYGLSAQFHLFQHRNDGDARLADQLGGTPLDGGKPS